MLTSSHRGLGIYLYVRTISKIEYCPIKFSLSIMAFNISNYFFFIIISTTAMSMHSKRNEIREEKEK